jgi:four helix bundle protein
MTYSFESVIAWQKAHSFVLAVYKYSKNFPEEEKYGLTSQFRRAAVSIEANIAEGYKKLGRSDKLRFFNISQGSIEECRDYIILARDLEFVNEEEFKILYNALESASKMLMLYCERIRHNAAIKD